MNTINTDLIYPFLQHLKKNGGVNYLHFCLAVETFNKKMMVVDLSDEDLKTLHTSAKDLYDTYIRSGSPSFIKFDDDIVREISEIINQGHTGGIQEFFNTISLKLQFQKSTSSAPPRPSSELMNRFITIWRTISVHGFTRAKR